jgi:hypothetical protein
MRLVGQTWCRRTRWWWWPCRSWPLAETLHLMNTKQAAPHGLCSTPFTWRQHPGAAQALDRRAVQHLLVVKTQESDRAWPVKTKCFQRLHCTRGGPRTCKCDGVPKKEITGKKTLLARRSDLWPVRPPTSPGTSMQLKSAPCTHKARNFVRSSLFGLWCFSLATQAHARSR